MSKLIVIVALIVTNQLIDLVNASSDGSRNYELITDFSDVRGPTAMVDHYCLATDPQIIQFSNCFQKLLPPKYVQVHQFCFERTFGDRNASTPLLERNAAYDQREKLDDVVECMLEMSTQLITGREPSFEQVEKCFHQLFD